MGLPLLNRWVEDVDILEGEVVVEDGDVTSYAFLKVLRTVGDAPAPAVKERERPVVELPKVRGRDVVWRVSFGREVIPRWSPGWERQDMVVEEHEEDRASGEEG